MNAQGKFRKVGTILLLVTGLFLLSSACVFGAEASPRFLSAMADIPLVPGFEEMEADSVLFDKPDGRIVEAYALGPSKGADIVLAYYKSVLPRFGWREERTGVFIRSAERITIETAQKEGKIVIRYRISPRNRSDPPP